MPLRTAAMSPAPLPRGLDHRRDAVQLFRARSRIEQRGHHVFRRALEECVQHMAKRGAPGPFGSDLREVNITRPLLLVADVAFLLHDAKRGADGGVTWRIWNRSLDLSNRSRA